jgi:hypothetical protein
MQTTATDLAVKNDFVHLNDGPTLSIDGVDICSVISPSTQFELISSGWKLRTPSQQSLQFQFRSVGAILVSRVFSFSSRVSHYLIALLISRVFSFNSEASRCRETPSSNYIRREPDFRFELLPASLAVHK